MRFVNRNYRIKPKKFRDQFVIAQWEKIALTKDVSLISSNIYSDPYDTPEGRRSKVIDTLNIWYHNKCAYCERVCKADVEHYRPSKAVKDLNNRKIVGHNGYYWLCYEWTNLIPSCINCNREGAKHNKFTVLKTYRTLPKLNTNGTLDKKKCKHISSFLSFEQPVLLNPEIDNPINFFEFELTLDKTGIKMVGIDQAYRGRDTIDICLLNREELTRERYNQVVLDFVEAINCAVASLKMKITTDVEFKKDINQILQALYNKSNSDKLTFTLLRKFIVASSDNFEKIMLPYIEIPFRSPLLLAFKNYRPH